MHANSEIYNLIKYFGIDFNLVLKIVFPLKTKVHASNGFVTVKRYRKYRETLIGRRKRTPFVPSNLSQRQIVF